MIYRCIGDYTTDAELKAMLHQMSRDEIRHYSYFRDLFDRFDADERNSFWRKARTVLARSELARSEDLALAFAPLNQAWREPAPFTPLTFPEFLTKAGQVMSLHFPIEAAKRMLFRPLAAGRAWEATVISGLTFLVRKQYGIKA